MPQGFSTKELAEPLYNLEKRIAEPYKNDFPELARAVSGSFVDFTLCEFAGGLVDWRMKRRRHARRQERLMDDPVALGSLRLQIGSIWPSSVFTGERLSHCDAQKSPFSQILHQLSLLSHCKVPSLYKRLHHSITPKSRTSLLFYQCPSSTIVLPDSYSHAVVLQFSIQYTVKDKDENILYFH